MWLRTRDFRLRVRKAESDLWFLSKNNLSAIRSFEVPGDSCRIWMSNLFLQRVSYKLKNVARVRNLMIIQTLNDELKLSLY